MKPLNSNRANLLLLFTRDPFVKLVNKELEYYSSDDDSLIGFVSLDREDYTFHAMLFDRDSRNKYCLVSMKLDYCSIEEARLGLEKLMDTYVRNEIALRKDIPANDFFIPVTKQEQRHPFFDKLLDKEVFLLQQNQLLRNCLSTLRIETVILLINFNLKMALMLEYGSCTYGAISEKRISISVMIMMHQTS